MVVFQSVILQRAQGVYNYKHIHKRIFFSLDYWNRGLFDEIEKDTFNAATGYLGKARGIQIKEQRQSTFSNLVLNLELCEEVNFSVNGKRG